jgi:hypothetical protein
MSRRDGYLDVADPGFINANARSSCSAHAAQVTHAPAGDGFKLLRIDRADPLRAIIDLIERNPGHMFPSTNNSEVGRPPAWHGMGGGRAFAPACALWLLRGPGLARRS